MSRRQGGFSVVEWLILAVVIGVLVCIVWLVFTRNGQKPAAVDSNTSKPLKTTQSTMNQSATKASSGSQLNTQSAPTVGLQHCMASSLKMSVGMPQETAGTIYADITYTNISSQSCAMEGFPTVTLTDSKGNDLGKPADDDGPSNGLVKLAPSQSAVVTVSVANPGFLPPGQCTADSTYILVNVPNDSRYLQADFKEAYCPGFAVTTLKPSS